jgi:DNA-binding MarR family transcriptional regulator
MVHSVSIKILRLVRVEDAKSGIGPAQLSALSVLVFAGARTLRELAALEQVKAPTMSRIVDGLVRQGLAARITGATDRRSVSISATAKGKKLLLAGKARRVQALAKRFASLSTQEIAILEQAAEILARA